MNLLGQLRKKAKNYYFKYQFLTQELKGESNFPWAVPLAFPTGKALGEKFISLRSEFSSLITHSKERIGFGHRIEFKEINHSKIGRQIIPHKIFFDTPLDLAMFVGKKKEFLLATKVGQKIQKRHQKMFQLICLRPLFFMENINNWDAFEKICNYFLTHPMPRVYIRELEIEGIDTKFIEGHKKALKIILDFTLPANFYNESFSSLSNFGFEKRFGLKFDLPRVRFRILDKNMLTYFFGIDDLEITIQQFESLNFACKKIFITENKITGLSFPMVADSIVIFGMGYGVYGLRDVKWMKDKEIYYWGDIDSHGFSILSLFRKYFPATRSLLMDEKTLITYRNYWVQEIAEKKFEGELSNLTDSEMVVYQGLLNQKWGNNIRLEQERIPLSAVPGYLSSFQHTFT